MKWDYDVQQLRELVASGSPVQDDVVEALRAIAEQLERIAEQLVDVQARRPTVTGKTPFAGVCPRCGRFTGREAGSGG